MLLLQLYQPSTDRIRAQGNQAPQIIAGTGHLGVHLLLPFPSDLWAAKTDYHQAATTIPSALCPLL